MSHDRGCPCGREKYEYDDCTRKDCDRRSTTANDNQVGGDHYKSEYQHWDFIELNGIGYLEAAATKYVARWRKKGGLRDLEKALHYTDKLIELHAQGRRLPRGIALHEDVYRFAQANELTTLERDVMIYLTRWSDTSVLRKARCCIVSLMDQARDIENTVADATGQDSPHGYDPEQDDA